MKVQCPNCGEIPYETTNTFNPDVLPNGGMVELIGEAQAYGHPKFGDRGEGGAEIEYSEMECCWCDAQLAPEGRLKVLSEEAARSKPEKGVAQVAALYAGKKDIPVISHLVASEEDVEKVMEGSQLTTTEEPSKVDQAKPRLLEKKKDLIQHYLSEGIMTQVAIAEQVGTSPAYVSNVARKMREENG